MAEQAHHHDQQHSAPSAEATIAHMEDVARFELDTAAMFGEDIEVVQALGGFHATNARVSNYRARQFAAGSPDREAAMASALQSQELAAQFAMGDELTAAQVQKVSEIREQTREEVIETAIEGNGKDFITKYGQERGQSHIDFYKDLAKEAIKRAK